MRVIFSRDAGEQSDADSEIDSSLHLENNEQIFRIEIENDTTQQVITCKQ